MVKKDYYDVLGVPRGANGDQIKRAYRRLARKYHPDVSKDAHAVEKFKEIQEAYQVLSDKSKRAAYDQFGHAGVGMGAGVPPGGWPYGPGGGRVYYSTGRSPGAADFDVGDFATDSGSLEDIFGQLLGKSTRRRGRARRAAARGTDTEHKVTLKFEQAVWGTTLRVQIDRPDPAGKVSKETIDVKIPPGVKDGTRIRVKGKGQTGIGGAPAGDLYIVVQVKTHAYFRRDGNDIYLDVPITVSEAILGTRITMPTIDGPTTVTIPPGTSGGQKLRLRGKGCPDPKTQVRGDQYAVIKITVPSKKDIDEDTKEAARKLGRAAGDPRKDLPWPI